MKPAPTTATRVSAARFSDTSLTDLLFVLLLLLVTKTIPLLSLSKLSPAMMHVQSIVAVNSDKADASKALIRLALTYEMTPKSLDDASWI